MGTLSSELVSHAQRLASRPRIYADANVPAGIVAYMRLRLRWDVLFVIEEDALRRAADIKHYRLAQLRLRAGFCRGRRARARASARLDRNPLRCRVR